MIWAVLLLALLLLMFLLGPLWYQKSSVRTEQSEENLRLYQERCADLLHSDLEDEQKQALQLELDREFLVNSQNDRTISATQPTKRWPAPLLMLVFVVLGTLSLYQFWGADNELKATELLRKSTSQELSSNERNALIERVNRAATTQTKNFEWSYLKGRLHLEQGQFDLAAVVFADLLTAMPMDDLEGRSTLMNLLAQARFFAAGQKADQDTYQLLQQSLELNPKQPQTQGLAGMMAFELGHYRFAIEHWKALWLAIPETPESQLLVEGMQRAAQRLQEQGEAADLSFLTQRIALTVRVDISPELRQLLPKDSTVFVAARAQDGPAIPLAARKLSLSDLPKEVVFTDADAMMSGMSLSDYPKISLRAHISRNGQPAVSSGDYVAKTRTVDNLHKEPILLLIDAQQP